MLSPTTRKTQKMLKIQTYNATIQMWETTTKPDEQLITLDAIRLCKNYQCAARVVNDTTGYATSVKTSVIYTNRAADHVEGSKNV